MTIAIYGRDQRCALNHPWLTLSVALSTLLLSVLLWVFIPKGFFPAQDNVALSPGHFAGTAIQLLCQYGPAATPPVTILQ